MFSFFHREKLYFFLKKSVIEQIKYIELLNTREKKKCDELDKFTSRIGIPSELPCGSGELSISEKN